MPLDWCSVTRNMWDSNRNPVIPSIASTPRGNNNQFNLYTGEYNLIMYGYILLDYTRRAGGPFRGLRAESLILKGDSVLN